MKIMILDDDHQERKEILQFIQDYLYEHQEDSYEVVDFADEDSFWAAAALQPPQIAFLDIYLNGQPRGTAIAREMRRQQPDCLLVFITSSADFAVEGFSLQAVHYCLKPVTSEAIQECFRRCEERLCRESPQLIVSENGDTCAIPLADVCYVESHGHVVAMHLKNRPEPMMVRRSLTSLAEEELKERRFLRVNRSFIINMDFVRTVEHRSFCMTDGVCIPMRRQDSLVLRHMYRDYIFDRVRRE